LREDEGGGEIARGGRILLRSRRLSLAAQKRPTIPTSVGANLPPVIAGLDPAIHPPSERLLAKKMDARVRPAHDESRTTRPGAGAFTPGAGSSKNHGAESIRPPSRHILTRQSAGWSSAGTGAERGYQL